MIWLTLFSLLLTAAILLGLIGMALLAVGVPLVFEALGAEGWLLIVGRAIGVALAAAVLIMLVGGEINAQLEYQTAEDTTAKAPRPMGERGAFVADHVAASRNEEL